MLNRKVVSYFHRTIPVIHTIQFKQSIILSRLRQINRVYLLIQYLLRLQYKAQIRCSINISESDFLVIRYSSSFVILLRFNNPYPLNIQIFILLISFKFHLREILHFKISKCLRMSNRHIRREPKSIHYRFSLPIMTKPQHLLHMIPTHSPNTFLKLNIIPNKHLLISIQLHSQIRVLIYLNILRYLRLIQIALTYSKPGPLFILLF